MVGVVKMLNVCWVMKAMSEAPKQAQRAMGPALLHFHVLPAKVSTTMNSEKTAAFSSAPSQSICLSLAGPVLVGCGLCLGKRKI